MRNRRGRAQKRYEAERDQTQATLFEVPEDDADQVLIGVGELERDVNRMRLETSSNVYAQRRSTW